VGNLAKYQNQAEPIPSGAHSAANQCMKTHFPQRKVKKCVAQPTHQYPRSFTQTLTHWRCERGNAIGGKPKGAQKTLTHKMAGKGDGWVFGGATATIQKSN